MDFSQRNLTGPDLPVGVRDLEAPPERLALHGTWPLGPVVSVIGTRRPSSEGARFAERLARELSESGVVVASGGACGIDSAAHLGALAAGARTLVVAPCAFARPYPEKNRELFLRIVRSGGGYVSEHTGEVAAKRHAFFRRNALLVALSQLVVIVESPWRSGARNAGSWARRLGRPLYVVPHSPWNANGSGWLEEMRLGAGLITTSKDVLAALARQREHILELPPALPTEDAGSAREQPEQLGLPLDAGESARVVLGVLASGPHHLDQLVARTGLGVAAVQVAVAELCLAGRASVNPAGIVERA